MGESLKTTTHVSATTSHTVGPTVNILQKLLLELVMGEPQTREFLKTLTFVFKAPFYIRATSRSAHIQRRTEKRMLTHSVKLIKKAERETPMAPAETEFVDPNRWSKTVRSWVNEFQQDRRDESLPAFDSLFKDELP